MTGTLFHIIVWPAFGVALFVFGLAPGAALRLIVLAFRRDDPRRRELLAELRAVPRIERPFWVSEQLEIALFEGLSSRFGHWRMQWAIHRGRSLGYFANRSLLVTSEGKLLAVAAKDSGYQFDFTMPSSRVRGMARYILNQLDLRLMREKRSVTRLRGGRPLRSCQHRRTCS